MSSQWVYVRVQLMMFVFGIVGPIFLFVYFAAQPDLTIRWMYWWGLTITVGDVLLALAVTDTVLRKDRELAARRAARRAGEEAS
ncbi:MAG: hypothetical protein AB1925_10925 [Actinomycetota bacterium]